MSYVIFAAATVAVCVLALAAGSRRVLIVSMLAGGIIGFSIGHAGTPDPAPAPPAAEVR